MSDIAKQISDLSAGKRQLLDRYLKSAGLNLSNTVIIPQKRDTDRFPLSFAQQRLWFIDQLELHVSLYNMPDTHYFNGPLNLDALERSLSEIIRRHEILRTTFQTFDGEPVQVIAPPSPLKLEVVDISHLPAPEREAEAKRLADDEAQQPFDLSRGPLLRLRLVRLEESKHALLVTMHHIISDGWSLSIWARELGTLYETFSSGQTSPLPDLPIQYADFAVWQREWLQGDVLEKQLGYWREQLGGELPELELPTDRPRPAVATFRGGAEALEYSKELKLRLKEISRDQGATLFMTLLAAFNVLIWRYGRQKEILVGTPIANRNRTETESLIGFFVNTLVLRTKLSGEMTFRDLLAQVRETTLAAYEHQDVPFEKLVEELQPERSLSRQPIFQVLFALQDGGELKLPGLELTWMDTEIDIAKFDLSLFMTESESGLYSWFEYNIDIFDRSTIARMLKHFGTLLDGIVANPDARLSELPLLTLEEQEQLRQWNRTASDYGRDLCLQPLVEKLAEQEPEAPAVRCGDHRISYRELNERANQLAHYLRGRGVGAEARVAILLERSIDLIVAMLGILKAGGAYVPLDGEYPVQRLRFMLEDAEARFLLTERKQPEVVTEGANVEVFYLDEGYEALQDQSQENPASATSADNLAYVMYTSGSSGQPKGVGITHRAINRLLIHTNYVELDRGDRVAQVCNASFDGSTFEIWGALLNGGQLVIFDKETLLSPAELKRQISACQISAMFLPTALFNQMAQSVPEAFSSLRYLVFGGEAGDVQSVRRVLEQGKPQHLLNGYGPTEGTTFTTSFEINDLPADARTIPIGRAISNTEVWVLDQQGQLAPVGVPGELHVGGDGLGREYLRRPELTAEKFVPHPFSKQSGSRLYRTGDLVRLLADGNIEFINRIDQQVKIRGYRVELGEIEAALNQYWAISESIVLDREGPAGSRRLIAYVVPEEGVEPTSSEIYTYLQEKVPSYMLPSVFVTIKEVPLTPNGKVDRKALPLPDRSEAEAHITFVAPRTDLEETLAGIWRETLGISQVGVESNFFDLGGHSLLATRVVSQIRERCCVELPLRVLFESPTLAGLARHLEKTQLIETDLGRIFSMLESMEKISEEEVNALLAQTESQA